MINWDEEKNDKLKKHRGVSFEDIEEAIYGNNIIDVVYHNKIKYPQQKSYIVKVWNYIYYVPFVRDEKWIFLKTIIPSRKYKKLYNL